MKQAAFVGVMLTVGLVIAADAGKELEAFQGRWELTASEKDGTKQPIGTIRVVKDDTYTIEKDGKTLSKGTIKLDPSASPKTIDITRAGGKPMLGIYTLEGDLQKVCFAPEGKDRPKAFSSKDGNTLSEWKKLK